MNKQIMQKIFSDSVLICMLFFYIFAFKLFQIANIGTFDSASLLGIVLLFFFIFKKKYRIIVVKNITKIFKNLWLSFIFIILILGISFLAIKINNTNDYTYFKTFIHLVIGLIIGFLLFSFYEYRGQKTSLVNHIIIIFIIQSILQWIFILNPTFSNWFDIFRSQDMITLRNERYNYYRGIAITGSGFFSLSLSYGICFMLYCSKYNTLCKNKILFPIIFTILIAGSLFSGRTALLALPFSIIALFQRGSILTKIKKNFKAIAIGSCISLFIVSGLFSLKFINQNVNSLYNFTFEAFINLKNGKSFTSSSTAGLTSMLEKSLTEITQPTQSTTQNDQSTTANATNTQNSSPANEVTVNKNILLQRLIGEGRYTQYDEDNKPYYYKKTDVGYARKIFFFGVIGLILSILLELSIFGKSITKPICILVAIYIFLLEFKGEIIGLNLMPNSIIIIISLLFIQETTQNYNPLVSVILCTYNTDAGWLQESIASILSQTYSNLELIVIVDGCDDDKKIKNINDKRLTIIKLPSNLGLAGARNKGISVARGEFIALMDSDDIARKTRIADQVKFIQDHPSVTICSTFRSDFGTQNRQYCEGFNHNDMSAQLLFMTPISNPTAFMRKDFLINNNIHYNDKMRNAEDYDFWCYCFRHGAIFARLKKVELNYRRHTNQASHKRQKQQFSIHHDIIKNNLAKLGITDKSSLIFLQAIANTAKLPSKKDCKRAIRKILKANRSMKIYPHFALKKVLKCYYNLALLHERIFFIPNLYFIFYIIRRKFYESFK